MTDAYVQRCRWLPELAAGKLTTAAAAQRLNLSVRQVRRWLRRYRRGGVPALRHRLAARPSNHRYATALKTRVLTLLRDRYHDCGPTLAAQLLATREHLTVHRETLRRWMHAAHFMRRVRKRQTYRQRRDRLPAFGQMLQLDGSPHRWFGGATTCLLNLIDDASSLNLCYFDHAETVRAAVLLLWHWLKRHGIPQSLYCDRRNAYLATDLASSAGLFGQFCQRLGIHIIPAFSPQAKGRVERSNQTHQDRLIPQLRLAKVCSIEQANAFLPRYLADHNRRFALPRATMPDVHRPLPKGTSLDDWCYTETPRKVTNDWTIQFNGATYQLLPRLTPCPAKATVFVRQTFHGRLSIWFRHHQLRFRKLRPTLPSR